MKPNPDREELLHELLDESTARGPSADVVLNLVRAERVRRQRRRAQATTAAAFTVLGLCATVLLTRDPAPQLARQTAPAPPVEPFAVKRVDDEEFLKLLAQQDQPVALVKLANGERRLLMVSRTTPPTEAP